MEGSHQLRHALQQDRERRQAVTMNIVSCVNAIRVERQPDSHSPLDLRGQGTAANYSDQRSGKLNDVWLNGRF